jgi:hypothetical protein
MDTIRALCRHRSTWHDLIPAAAFAINAAPSRTLDMHSPFEITHGFTPRLPLHAALGSAPLVEPVLNDLDEYTSSLVTQISSTYEKVRKIQDESTPRPVLPLATMPAAKPSSRRETT